MLYAFEDRKGKLIKQYSTAYSTLYENRMNHMIERRMRQSVFAVASFWYTAWVNAGQPSLDLINHDSLTISGQKEFEILNLEWKKWETHWKGLQLRKDCCSLRKTMTVILQSGQLNLFTIRF